MVTNFGAVIRVLVVLSAAVPAGCSNVLQAPQTMPPGSVTLPAGRASPRSNSLTENYVRIPVNNSIQEDLISTFPVGMFKPKHGAFSIPSKPKKCGYYSMGACNFYDGFT